MFSWSPTNTFFKAQTSLFFFFLGVAVSPQWVKLLGADKSMSAGRLYEIKCHVYGANPSPVIKWTKGNDKMKNLTRSVSFGVAIRQGVLQYSVCVIRFPTNPSTGHVYTA
jgi:hypothetical protein